MRISLLKERQVAMFLQYSQNFIKQPLMKGIGPNATLHGFSNEIVRAVIRNTEAEATVNRTIILIFLTLSTFFAASVGFRPHILASVSVTVGIGHPVSDKKKW